MAPLSTQIRVEISKIIRRPMTWVLGILFLLLMAFIYGTFITLLIAPDVEGLEFDQAGLESSMLLPDGLYFGAGIALTLLSIMLVILGASVFGSEFSWATLRTMLLMGANRMGILTSKLIALLFVATLATIIGTAVSIGGAMLAGLVSDQDLPLGDWLTAGFITDTAGVLLLSLVVIAIWTLFAVTITIFTRSLAAGLSATLALNFIGSPIANLLDNLGGQVGTWIARVFPNTAINEIMMQISATPPSIPASDLAWIIASIAGWSILLIGLAVITLRRMDVLASAS